MSDRNAVGTDTNAGYKTEWGFDSEFTDEAGAVHGVSVSIELHEDLDSLIDTARAADPDAEAQDIADTEWFEVGFTTCGHDFCTAMGRDEVDGQWQVAEAEDWPDEELERALNAAGIADAGVGSVAAGGVADAVRSCVASAANGLVDTVSAYLSGH